FGLLLGSFLNVCSLRWPVDESVVSPPSHCPGCDEPIRWYDNVPVASWLVLRGRCRACAEPISPQYPLTELGTALVWAGVFAAHGASWEAVRGGIFLTILFGIAISDARFYIIPDQFSVGGAAVGLATSFLPGGIGWTQAALGAAVGYGAVWLAGGAGARVGRRSQRGGLEGASVAQAPGGGHVERLMMDGRFARIWRGLL